MNFALNRSADIPVRSRAHDDPMPTKMFAHPRPPQSADKNVRAPMNPSAEHRLGSSDAIACQLAGAVPGAPIHKAHRPNTRPEATVASHRSFGPRVSSLQPAGSVTIFTAPALRV